ncbi:hypothetical protein, partial [Streptomyces sp. Adlamb9]|uniref:hypothetical protein n=1 Tax=Streptomyces sp. Adlamb9 TaxID=3400629 RepID=UPI003F1C516B
TSLLRKEVDAASLRDAKGIRSANSQKRQLQQRAAALSECKADTASVSVMKNLSELGIYNPRNAQLLSQGMHLTHGEIP